MMFYLEPEISDEAVRTIQATIVPAIAYFMSRLARLVDLSQLTVGDDEQDYFVPIAADELHETSLRIIDLEIEVQERFGVRISVLPIPMRREEISQLGVRAG